MLMDEQVAKLHTEIVVKKKKVHMLSNSEDLQLYLQLAFDHSSRNLDEPFNFVKVALKVNPIPSDFGGNILKLAVAIKDHHPLWKLAKIFEHLSLIVASSMLDIDRHRRLGKRQLHFPVMDWSANLLMNGIIDPCYSDDYESRNTQTVA